MAGARKKPQSDDERSYSSDSEALSKVKKTDSAKKNGAKSNAKRTTSRSSKKVKPAPKSRKAKASSDEESVSQDNQEESDISDSENIPKNKSSKASEKKVSGRSNRTSATPSNPTEKRLSARSKSHSEGNEVTSSYQPDKRSSGRSKTSGKGNDVASSKDTNGQKEKSDDESEDNADDDEDFPVEERAPKKPREKKPAKEEEEQYEVEEILDFKIEDNIKYFLIRWKGFDSSVDSWEKQRSLNCPGLIFKFYEQHPEARKSTQKRKHAKNFDFTKKKKKPKVIPKLKIDEEPDYDSEAFDENEDWKVEKILDVRYHRENKRDFLIRWEGYSSKSDTWEPEENLNCPDLIKKFTNKLENIKNVTVKELRVARARTQHFTLMTQSTDRRLSRRHDGRQRAVYYDCEE